MGGHINDPAGEDDVTDERRHGRELRAAPV
jgi:hypothetical protein